MTAEFEQRLHVEYDQKLRSVALLRGLAPEAVQAGWRYGCQKIVFREDAVTMIGHTNVKFVLRSLFHAKLIVALRFKPAMRHYRNWERFRRVSLYSIA